MHYKYLLLILILSFGEAASAQELPPANFENSFYILPLFARDILADISYEETEMQYLKVKSELGVGNLYHRLGFSFIYSVDLEGLYYQDFKLATEYGLHLGLIFALQSHSRDDYRAIADVDLRHYQWRLDGEDWKGSFTNSGTLEVPEDQRDYKVPTPSRYAGQLRAYNFERVKKWARSVLGYMEEFPGVVTSINGPIEEELTIGGIDIMKLSDYSPFAITEYRDWLRHAGLYDASDGEYAGEGATSIVVGNLIEFNGMMRSQFYDDPTPANSNGTGVSFNDFFGTTFQTWSLKYWDLTIYPDPITDEEFDVSPESGIGFCANGFDAPRELDANNPFWNAWSYDIPDHGGIYPFGNPSTPAYGFRQNMVRNFVRDLFTVLKNEGIPENLMYAHQIPGETLGDFTGEAERNRSSASTIWTGYLEDVETVGITKFGIIDPTLLTQYADDWGIFEWHPLPFATPSSLALYDATIQSLNSYYANKCHILFPGWWYSEPPAADEIFPLNDSKFSEALGDFMETREEVPYHEQGSAHVYTPPPVNGVHGLINDGKLEIDWNQEIWVDLIAKWTEWGDFDYFEVQWSEDGVNWDGTDTTTVNHFVTSVVGEEYQLRVRVNATSGLAGPWSEVIHLESSSVADILQLDPKYSILFFDESVKNPIRIKVTNEFAVLIPDSLQVSISGDGVILNTVPTDVEGIDKFWPMNSTNDIPSYNGIEHLESEGGIISMMTSSDEPIDPYFFFAEGNIDGGALPYISLRMYAEESSQAQFFWFYDDTFDFISFDVQKGWHIYQIENIPEWTAVAQIENIRLDPSTLGSSLIMIDWLAISSQPISDQLESAIYIEDEQAIIMTSPLGEPGSYTVTVDYKGNTNAVLIETNTFNQAPEVSLLMPTMDTTIELGQSIYLEALAMDSDGVVKRIELHANSSLIKKLTTPPFSYDWTPINTGVFQIDASAFDNANELVISQSILLNVIEQTPYGNLPHLIPGIIEAEDYDIGGTAIAFSDNEEENQGGSYRGDAVDIGAIPDEADQYYLGWTDHGEWLEYTIDVEESGKMEFIVHAATIDGGGELHLEIDDKRVTNNLFVGSTGADQVYQTFTIEDIFLNQGIQTLKLFIDKGGINIDNIEIRRYQDSHVEIKTPLTTPQLLLYPNPVNDKLRFRVSSSQPHSVEIWSMTGQLVKVYELGAAHGQTINVGDLTIGVYVVYVLSDNQTWVGRITKL